MRKHQRAMHAETQRRGAYFRGVTSWIAAVMLLTLSTAGCGRSPQTTFYTLTPTVPVTELSKLSGAVPSVAIASVTLPELVDRPQLVVTESGSKVTILEASRWAEPLKSAVARSLAENISRLLGLDQVSYYPQHAAYNPDYRIFVDIQRFESTGATVRVEALWSIRGVKEGKPVRGHSKITEQAGATDYEAMVAGYSKAVAALSKDIAQAVRGLQTKK